MAVRIQGDLETKPLLRASRMQWTLALGAFLVFVVLSVAYSLTQCPWWDEGLFADTALTFRNLGHLGSSVLAPYGYLEWPGVHQYTYWNLPLYPIVLGTWFRLAPATVVSMRLFSLLWACIFVFSWFMVIRSITRKEPLALLVASVVALNYVTIFKACDGRMDMMCAALGLAGLASYFWFRDSHWTVGIVAASWFGAASLFCHPMGIVTNVWLAAMVLLDWRQIRWRAVMLASIPYLIGLACCFYYIHEAPDVFLMQSKAASEYRVSGLGTILQNIWNDFNRRYINYFYVGYRGIDSLKVTVLIFALAGPVALLVSRDLHPQPITKRLLLISCIAYVGVALLNNQAYPNYFIYSISAWVACGAVWVYARWRQVWWKQVALCCLLGFSVVISLGGVGYKIYENEYRTLYDPAVAVVRSSLPPGGTVMGGSEFGFALGFGPPLIDDRYLGFFSGKAPDVYVLDRCYTPITSSPRLVAAWQSSRVTLREQYRLTFKNKAYDIYVRRDTSAIPQSGK